MESTPQPTESEVRTALSCVLNSEALRNSDRSKEFLSYVVEQSLSGRAKHIKGKTIAADVFGRNPTELDSDNVVRVEARRVRRKLNDYYGSEGVDDALRIHIDSGGYAPRFEVIETEAINAPPRKHAQGRYRTIWALLAVILIGLAAWAFVPLWTSPPPSQEFDNSAVANRKALREKSLSTLQAANLDLQGRNLLFPILDPKRQTLALSLFEEAITLDASYFGSYASAAHSYGTLALLAEGEPERQSFRARSKEMSQRAVGLAPQEAWAHAGRAWAYIANQEFDAAIKAARLAEEIDPQSGSVLDTYGMIMFMTGNFEDAATASDPNRSRRDIGSRLAYYNIYGVASFHLGHFDDAIDAFNQAIEMGAPVSPPTLVFLAASYEGLGRSKDAERSIAELKETYPNFDPVAVFSRFYRYPEHSAYVLDALGRAGWVQN